MLHPIDFGMDLVGLRESNVVTWAYHCHRGKLPLTVSALTTVPETLQLFRKIRGALGVGNMTRDARPCETRVAAGFIRNFGQFK